MVVCVLIGCLDGGWLVGYCLILLYLRFIVLRLINSVAWVV